MYLLKDLRWSSLEDLPKRCLEIERWDGNDEEEDEVGDEKDTTTVLEDEVGEAPYTAEARREAKNAHKIFEVRSKSISLLVSLRRTLHH